MSTQMRTTLIAVRETLQRLNDEPNGPIRDTLWHGDAETLFDFIDAALAPPTEQRCRYCDGTGDVHRIDGEWLGVCIECTAAQDKHSDQLDEKARSPIPQFPTMLRKMWSGGEVQRWIDENWNKAPAAPRAPDDGRCREVLREQGKAYPRTCAVCGRGPCRRTPYFLA